MSTVGIKELKNRLTEYLRRARKGEEIIVTDRGRPVAIIQAIQSAERLQSLQARLAKLEAQGVVSLPTRKPLRNIRLVRVSGTPLSTAIVEDRR